MLLLRQLGTLNCCLLFTNTVGDRIRLRSRITWLGSLSLSLRIIWLLAVNDRLWGGCTTSVVLRIFLCTLLIAWLSWTLSVTRLRRRPGVAAVAILHWSRELLP